MSSTPSSPYSSIQWTEWDRVNGIAPQILDILSQRCILLGNASLEPGLPALSTELIRGQNIEVRILLRALQDAGVGSLADAHNAQRPSGAEIKRES